ncbi:MAG: class I SAM-dependent methyltransferase [Lentisphaeria bacterium]|nr:class I SAM-dependent methyltransferase [Lentisphaeria bacterium]
MKKETRLAFGVTPSTRRYRLRYARYKALAQTLAEHSKERGGDDACIFDLLDIGSGFGRTAQYLEAEGISDRFRFHGVDIKRKRLDRVYQAERWELKQADVQEGIPYTDGRFDVAVCEQVIEHLRNPDFVIRESHRVLKPGGLLILGVPIFPSPLAIARHHLIPPLYSAMGIPLGSHIHFFTLRAITELILRGDLFDIQEARGFRIVSGGPLAFLEDFAWWWRFNLLLGRTLTSLCTEVQIVAVRKEPLDPGRPE